LLASDFFCFLTPFYSRPLLPWTQPLYYIQHYLSRKKARKILGVYQALFTERVKLVDWLRADAVCLNPELSILLPGLTDAVDAGWADPGKYVNRIDLTEELPDGIVALATLLGPIRNSELLPQEIMPISPV
jgi:hypothetical protein